MGFNFPLLRHILLKYIGNVRFSMVDPGIASGRNGVWKASVLKFGRAPSLTALWLCFSTLHTNAIKRTDSLVQVDCARVVDLDIGASKSDNLRDQSGHQFRSAPAELEQPRVRIGTVLENIESIVVRRLIAKEQHQDRGSSPSPLQRASCSYAKLRFSAISHVRW